MRLLELLTDKSQQQSLVKPVVEKQAFCQGYRITNVQDLSYLDYELWVNGQLHHKLPKVFNYLGVSRQTETFNWCGSPNFVTSGTAFIRLKHLGNGTHIDSDTFVITLEKPEVPNMKLEAYSDCRPDPENPDHNIHYRVYSTLLSGWATALHMYKNGQKVKTYTKLNPNNFYDEIVKTRSRLTYLPINSGESVTFTIEAKNGQESDHTQPYPLTETDFKPIIEREVTTDACRPYLIRNYQSCSGYTYTLFKGNQQIPLNEKRKSLDPHDEEVHVSVLDCMDPNYEPNTQYTLRVTNNTTGVTQETSFTTDPLVLEVETTPRTCEKGSGHRISNVDSRHFANLTFALYKDGNLVQDNMKADAQGKILNYAHNYSGNYTIRYKGVDSSPFTVADRVILVRPILAPVGDYKKFDDCCVEYQRFKIANYDPNLEYKVLLNCESEYGEIDEFYIAQQSNNTTLNYTILDTGEIVLNKCFSCVGTGGSNPYAIVWAKMPTTDCSVGSDKSYFNLRNISVQQHHVERISLANCERLDRYRLNLYNPNEYEYSILEYHSRQPIAGATINPTSYEIEGLQKGAYRIKIVRKDAISCVQEPYFEVVEIPDFSFELEKLFDGTCTTYTAYRIKEDFTNNYASYNTYRILKGTQVIHDWDGSISSINNAVLYLLGERDGAGTYILEGTNNIGCVKQITFEIPPLLTPNIPQIELHKEPTCSEVPQYRITNYNPAEYIYTIEKVSSNQSTVSPSIDDQGIITYSRVPPHNDPVDAFLIRTFLKRTPSQCMGESSQFAFYVYPTIGIYVYNTDSTCDTPSKHTLNTTSYLHFHGSHGVNLIGGYTYRIYNEQGQLVLSQKQEEVVGLPIGTYTAEVVTHYGCSSGRSEPFEVKGILGYPQKPVLVAHTQATCSSVSLFKIQNYDPTQTYRVYDDAYATNTELNGITYSAEGVVQGIVRDGRYRVEVVNSGGCQAISDPIEVQPKVPYPNKAGVDIYTPATCTSPNKYRISDYNDKLKYKIYTEAGTLVTNAIIRDLGHIEIPAGRYKIKVEGDSCESEFSEIFEIIDRLPHPPVPVVTTTQASCTQKSKHVVTLDAQYRYAVYSGDNPVSATVLADGTIFLPDGLPQGVYNVKAQDKITGCYSQGADFTTEPVRTKEVTPQVVLSAVENCQAPSSYKVQNFVAGVTYKVYHNSQVIATASVDNQGNVLGLEANKVYTIVAEKTGSCASDHSNAFAITPKKYAPAQPTLQEIGFVLDPTTCKEVAQYRITNYNNAYQYKICDNPTGSVCNEVQNIVIGSGGVINGVLPANFKIEVTDPVGTCSSSATFTRTERAYTYPKPAVGAHTHANCNSVSTFQLTNYDAQATYTILDHQNGLVAGAHVDNQGVITGIQAHGDYKVKAVRGACESVSDTFSVGAQLPVPQKPVIVEVTPANCTSVSVYKVQNITNSAVYKVYRNNVEVTTASVDTNTGNIQNLTEGTYTIKAFQGTCQSEASESFVIQGVKPMPQKPVVDSKSATCSRASSHQIQNVETGVTYEVHQAGQKVSSAVVTADGKIQNLTAGNYHIKAIKDGCDSDSDTFVVEDQKPSPMNPVVTKVTDATCDHTTIYQVQGYNTAYTYVVEYYNGNPVVATPGGGTSIEVIYNPVTWARVNPNTGNVEIDKEVYKAILPAQHTTDTPALRVVVTMGGCTQYSGNFLPEVALDKPAIPRVVTQPATCTSASVSKIEGYDSQNTYRVYNQTSGALVGAVIDDVTGTITGLTQGETYVLKVFKGCESEASNTFAFEQQHTAPAPPSVVLQSPATCTSKAVYKIENYDPTHLDYGYYTSQDAFGTFFPLTQVDNNGVLSLPVATYKIEVHKKGQSCKVASSEFIIEDVKQKPQVPSVQVTQATCQNPTLITIDNYTNVNTYKVYDQVGTLVNTAVINAGTITGLVIGQSYTLKVTTPNGCESDASSAFTYQAPHTAPQQPLVVRHSREDCTSATLFKIQNYDANLRYVVYNLQFVNAAVRVTIDSEGVIQGLRAGEYNVEVVTPHGCTSVSDNFEVRSKLRTPDRPNVVLYQAESCNSTTQYHIDAYSRGATYKIYDNAHQLVTNATISSLGLVSGLPVGTYTMSVTVAGCESEQSDSFEIKDKLPKPAKLAEVTERLCPTAQTQWFDLGTLIQPQTGNTLRWYNDPTTNAYTEIAPTQDRKVNTRTVVTQFVTQVGANCESERTQVTLIIDDTQAPDFTNLPNNLVINCQDVDFDQKVSDWLAQAQATDNCVGAVQVQNNYTKPANLCDKGKIEITFTIEDSFGNKKIEKSSIVFITAKDDDFTTDIVPSTGGIVHHAGIPVNVLTNDRFNGNVPDISQVTIVVEGSSNPNVTIDTHTGQVVVGNGTPDGVHTITYRICDKAHHTACSQVATVSVKVSNTPIVALQEEFEVNKIQGGTTPSVLENDTLDGNPVNLTEITLTKPNNLPHGITMDDQGRLIVPPNTPVGVYPFEYQICEVANPHNCSTTTSSISVTDKNVIKAVTEDLGPVSSVAGGITQSVLSNDTLNGTILTRDAVVLTKPTNLPSGITMNDDGTLSVASGTIAGVYSFDYTICDASDVAICSSVTSRVRVSDVSNGGLDLDKVTDKVEVRVGGKITYRFKVTNNSTNVLTDVKLTDRKLGIVDRVIVPALNPGQGAELTYDYEITQQDIDSGKVVNTAFVTALNPARETVGDTSDNGTPSVDENKDGDVGNDPTITILRTIEANPDKGSFVGKSGGYVNGLNVLNNDKLGTFPEVNQSNVVLTSETSNQLKVHLDGTIEVLPGVPTGTYQVNYTICDATIPELCATTSVTIEVVNDACVLQIFNAISANNDGQNDALYIENIDCYPDNVVRIFNRWGIEVFNTERYNNRDKVFKGLSNGRVTIGDKKLPQGTYYIIIEYKTDSGEVKQKGTWIYLSNNN